MSIEDLAHIPATHLPAIVWQANSATLEFRSVYGASEQILGYGPSHWRNTPGFFAERIYAEDRAATLALYRTAIAQNADATAEYRGISAAGTVWLRETIRVSGSTITGVITAIGRRRQLEEQTLRASRSEALRELTSRLARDLRNPLTILAGYGEDLLNTVPASDPLRGDIEQILAAGEQISGLANRLLRFGSHRGYPPGVVNVPRAIVAMEDRIAETAGEGVVVEIAPGVSILAFAEERQFEEVILALVSGSREGARVRSHVTIQCELDSISEQLPGSTLAPGRYARISIDDDGRGCGRERCLSVFESVLSGEEPGLARAYALVREWGGDVAFSSQPVRGSGFAVYLPYCPEIEL